MQLSRKKLLILPLLLAAVAPAPAAAQTAADAMFTVFLDWVSPTSRKENQRCIMNTNSVATSIHVLLTVNIASAAVWAAAGAGAKTAYSSGSMNNDLRENSMGGFSSIRSQGKYCMREDCMREDAHMGPPMARRVPSNSKLEKALVL